MQALMDRGPENVRIFTLLSILLLFSPRHSHAQWKPQDVYRINCGASDPATDSSGIEWQPDSDNPKLVSSGSSSNSTSSGAGPPYSIARIFTSVASYSFSVSPGRHWIRLHFSTFSAPADARFSVAIGSRLLLHNTTIPRELAGRNSSTVVAEFFIPAAGTALAITFIPLPTAFVNGIELISMAHDSISPSVVEVEPRDQNENRQLEIASLLARTLIRLNVGGGLISPANDSGGQSRSWEPDAQFLQGSARGIALPPAIADIVYPATVPEYIAPRGVYGTARSMGSSNTVSNSFNISWLFPLGDSGDLYSHYLRLHFAEIVYTSPMQRIFSVYINNRTGIRALDLIQQTGAVNTPYYRDFLVLPEAGVTSLRLQIGPLLSSGSQFQDAILNGVEVFRVNDSSGSVDGLVSIPTPKTDPGHNNRKIGIIVGGVAGALFALTAVALVIGFCCYCKGRKKVAQKPSSSWHPLSNVPGISQSILSSTLGGSPRSAAGSYYNAGSAAGAGGHGRYFSFQEIAEATNGFDEDRLLGVGGFGRVYKGEIDNGTIEVAVKRGNPRSEQGIVEFQAEIGLLSKLRHRHLVSLIGYCDEQSEMILVYEYMARGPLRGHLYGTDNPPLSWRQRLEIVVGAARGLHYLHTGADHARAIIHRDVKTTNILLDEQLVAKVSDFGLSKTGPMLDQTHVSTAVKGSFGYLDPEYFRRQQLTDKSDVYSFGVVLVEVLCARPAIDPALPRDQVNIAEWAMQAQRSGRLGDILDPALRRPGTEEDADMSSVRKVAETAEKCLQEQGIHRPSMGDVLWNLESALHMQEAAARRHRNGSENGNAGTGGGGGTVQALSVEHQQQQQQRAQPPAARTNHRATDSDDFYDGYSEDTSASAVFSQLVNPQGR